MTTTSPFELLPDQFVLWQLVQKLPGEKPAKVPCGPDGRAIDHTNPANWMTYAQAVATGLPVAFVLTENDPFVFIDLDGCRDPITGAWSVEAQQVVAGCAGALMEISQSQTGLHIIAVCDQAVMGQKRRKWGGDKECYVAGRFIALTGIGLQGDPTTNITEFVRAWVPDRPDPTLTGIPDSGPVPEWSGPTDDTQLIGQALASRGSAAVLFGSHASFRDLWQCNVEALARFYPSATSGQPFDRSAADAALVMHLGFWTGKDAARTERLWRQSPLAQGRGKLDRADYVFNTITTGLQKVKAVYQGRAYAGESITQRLTGLGTNDDLANAFTHENQCRFIFNVTRGVWFEWTGRQWRMLPEGAMLDHIRRFCVAASGAEEKRTRSLGFWQAVLTACESDPVFLRIQDQFDADHYLLNTPSGTIDLRTGTLRPHDPADLITAITLADPASGLGTIWPKFLSEITCGDPGLARDLQIAFGASLSGAVEDHWLGFLHGGGRNGKSALTEAVSHVLGDYAGPVPSESFVAGRNDPHPTGLTTMVGKRLAYANEVPSGRYFNEALLKAVSGDNRITARFMRGDFFDFRRTFKLFLIGNDLPQIRATDVAMKRRLRIMPFNADFSGREDATLPERLRSEAGAILRWLLDGHRMWIEAGRRFDPSAAVAAMSDAYFTAQSTPDLWLTECAEIVPEDGRSVSAWPRSRDAYQNYRIWKSGRGEEPVSETRFGMWLRGKAGIRIEKANSMHCIGLSLGVPQLPGVLPFRAKI